MRIFKSDYKVNFVDIHDTLVGFDSEGSCCEFFGWFVSGSPDKSPEDFDIVFKQKDYGEFEFAEYKFDKNFWRIYRVEGSGDEGGEGVFRLVKDEKSPPLYLHIFNFHNGYYAHGFSFCKKGFVEIKGEF